MLTEHETITHAIPVMGTRTKNIVSRFEGMKVDAHHPRIFRFPEGTDLDRARHNIAQNARFYGNKMDWKFRVHLVEHEGAKVVAVWRIA